MVKWFKIKGAVYANTLPTIMKLKEAKKFVRDFLGVKRLPNNTEFWL